MSDTALPNVEQKAEDMDVAPAPATALLSSTGIAQQANLSIKVTDNNNEVHFKLKPFTPLEKLMGEFCKRQGKNRASVRFLFDGLRVMPTDTAEKLEMSEGDTIEAHQEQIGGGRQAKPLSQACCS